MSKIVSIVALFCLIQSICGACPDGTFTTALGGDIANHGTCTTCLPVCATCPDSTSCTTYISRVKGVDSTNAKKCTLSDAQGVGGAQSTYNFGWGIGYNSNTDSCEDCKWGCERCAIDYDICYSCYPGWDFDANNMQCVRATLGLAAVVLALSVLVLIVGIISCILACKLS